MFIGCVQGPLETWFAVIKWLSNSMFALLLSGSTAGFLLAGSTLLVYRVANSADASAVVPSSGHANVELPDCNTSSVDVMLINKPGDWSRINDRKYRVFCVSPGDYRSLGKIQLRSSGIEGAPRVIRYLSTTDNSPLPHAVKMSQSERAYIQGLHFSEASYWVIDRLSIVNNDPDETLVNRTVDLRNNSSHNLIQNSLIEGGRIGLRIYSSNFNTVLSNVVRETISTANDDNCINLEGKAHTEVRGNRIIGNEAYNCTDSLQLVTLADSHANLTFPGTVIDNNDFYLEPSVHYTNCKGRFDPLGNCSTAEGRFDIKGGGTANSVNQRVWVIRNRIWGARRTDPISHAGSSWGSGIAICCSPDIQYVVVENNIIFDNARGISVSSDNAETVVIRNNIVYGILEAVKNTGHALLGLSQTGNTWSNNTIIHSSHWALLRGTAELVHCNIVVAPFGDKSKLSETSDAENYFYTAADPTAETSFGNAGNSSGNRPFCFQRKLITGPENICIPEVLPTDSSPHWGKCGFDAGGSTASMGSPASAPGLKD